jgi:outer membrane protein OmpA-like peptidoglycan-associated protein
VTSWGAVHPVEMISARIDGEVTPGEVRYLEAHLRSCPACEQKEAELKAIVSELAGLEVPSLPAGTIDRLLAGLARRDAPAIVVTKTVTAELVPSDAPLPSEPPPVLALPTVPRFRWPMLGSAVAAVAVVVSLFFLLYPVIRGGRGDRTVAAAVSIPSAAPASPVQQDLPVKDEAAPAASTAEKLPRPTAPPRRPSMTWKEAPVAETPRVVALPEPQVEPEPLPEPAQPVLDEPLLDDARVDTHAALAPISFQGNSKRLTREAKERVEAVAELLRQQPDAHLLIHGYATGRGSVEKNRELGQRRAAAVARQIERLGIDTRRLRPVAFGETETAAGEDRVEFVLEP